MSKQTMVAALIGLNLFLLAVLIISSYPMPAAYAQGGGRAGDFACVTARASGQSYEVLFLLDVRERQLHAFFPTNPATKQLGYASNFINLEQDFRQQP